MEKHSENKQDALVRHAKSAGLTFVAVLIAELSLHMNGAESWSDLNWQVIGSAATFTAFRAALKFLAKQ